MLEAGVAGILVWVSTVFEELQIPYALGGSLASTVHGRFRNTNDADFVANMQLNHVAPFVEIIGDGFYRDVDMIRNAVVRRSSFNMIYLPTMFKVDVFVTQHRPFDKLQLERRIRGRLPGIDDLIYVTSAEDTILAKLHWFRLGGETSERQWRDVLEVTIAQSNRLDLNYMRNTALTLGVGDLLTKMLHAANQDL